MELLNPWILFGTIPLFLLYKKHIRFESRQIRLLYASLFFMLLALSEPVLKHSASQQRFDSQNLFIAIDASYSMQAEDLKPNRYEKAKQTVIKLLKSDPQDKFTIFAFTSNTLLICPPTTDSRIAIQALETLNPNYILTKSTSLYNLFKSIAKIEQNGKKHLLVFSDGGDERDIDKLAHILKKNNIIPYFIATATQKGAALQKDGEYLKDKRSSLVISKINPSLRDLASKSDGQYYELGSLQTINSLLSDIRSQESLQKEQSMKVQSYQELFYFPLFVAFVLYFISVTKLHQFFLFIPLVLLSPSKSNADLLDFYHLYQAKHHLKEAQFIRAAQEFEHLEPSQKSYYNAANSFYKAKKYKNALAYYKKIKTADKKLKEAILYNMGNCAVMLKMYDKAKKYYLYALALQKDKDALYNLNLIRDLHTEKKLQVSKITKGSAKQQKDTKQQNKKQKNSHTKNSSNQNSSQSVNGAGGNKKKKETGSLKKKSSSKPNNYKIGYKAYEIINKGYADEKEPW